MARTPQPSGTYARITASLYESLSRLPADDALRDVLLPRIAGALIDACEPQVTSIEPSIRLKQALTSLSEAGLAYEASEEKGEVALQRLDCRWSRVLGASEAAIHEERRVLAALLGVDASQIVHDGVKFVYRLPVPAMRD